MPNINSEGTDTELKSLKRIRNHAIVGSTVKMYFYISMFAKKRSLWKGLVVMIYNNQQDNCEVSTTKNKIDRIAYYA